MKNIALNCIRLISKMPFAYSLSRKLVDLKRNENNCDPDTNGEMDFVKRNADRFATIFDVGANVGEWTDEVSRLCPTARIHSFEPVSATFKRLSAFESERVTPHRIGFGNVNEEIEIFVSDSDSTLNSVFSRESVGVTKPEKITVRKVDDFCAEHGIDSISFLKIDTEGNELEVLKGARKMIESGKVDAVQIEYGGTYINARILLKDVFDFFENTDYSLYKIMQTGKQKIEAYSQDLENFQYANYLAILNSYDHR